MPDVKQGQLESGFCAKSNRTGVRFKPPQEFKIIALRELPPPSKQWLCETPEDAVNYWRTNVATAPWYSPDRECSVAILLNVRNRVLGHHLISIGLVDAALVHPRETFRAAIIANAHSIILGHNHPSGDPTPSSADVVATRELVLAGKQLKIHVVDHIIVGHPNFTSLRQLGLIE